MNCTPLDAIEMRDLLRLIYPEIIKSNDDADFELSSDICEAPVWLGDGKEVTLAELLGRVAMMTAPMVSPLSGVAYHCLGKVVVGDSGDKMIAVVARRVV